ncbi:hypothetical protein OBBRIDRAFT_340806 [Obba rivulosa]|uniref:Uncharacterized protein n=1 Tax=Obba rivulosa TaxID=1052685 RepID=A0A8E2J2K3_9APHY|nr:hypothetical protein OBBRIDRAFT_340806 [Obba rivulosa]
MCRMASKSASKEYQPICGLCRATVQGRPIVDLESVPTRLGLERPSDSVLWHRTIDRSPGCVCVPDMLGSSAIASIRGIPYPFQRVNGYPELQARTFAYGTIHLISSTHGGFPQIIAEFYESP